VRPACVCMYLYDGVVHIYGPALQGGGSLLGGICVCAI
jgi:hypothetical protein